MTSANRTLLLLYGQDETEFGTEPAGTPAPDLNVRFNSEGLESTAEYEESDEIRDDGQIADQVRTNLQAGGPIAFDFSHGSYDIPIRATLLADADYTTELNVISADTNVSVDATSGYFDLAVGSWANTPTVGSWVQTAGFSNAANNSWFKVIGTNEGAAADPTATRFYVAGGATRLTTEAAGQSVTIDQASEVSNGTNLGEAGKPKNLFYIERHNLDLAAAQVVRSFLGMGFNSFSLSIPTNGKITGSFGTIGKKGKNQSATLLGTVPAKASTRVFNSVAHLVKVLEGDDTGLTITAFDFTHNNNLEARLEAGTGDPGPISLRKGTHSISGSLDGYLKNRTRISKFDNDTESSIALVLKDNAGNVTILDFARVVYTAAPSVTPGKNQDVLEGLRWSAKVHETLGYTFKVAKFAA